MQGAALVLVYAAFRALAAVPGGAPFAAVMGEIASMLAEGVAEIPQGARDGEIANFTGVSDPYEEPISPELRIETIKTSAHDNAKLILTALIEQGFVRGAEEG